MTRKVCIFATHHDYQCYVQKPKFLQNIGCLIEIHSVDLVAEEISGMEDRSYARQFVKNIPGVMWKNVDLSRDERKFVPDLNPDSLGTQIDYDLHNLREWVWVIRTSKAMNQSALIICGLCHLFSLADKFQTVGLEVETHFYLDNVDNPIERMKEKIERLKEQAALSTAKIALLEIALTKDNTDGNCQMIANNAVAEVERIRKTDVPTG
jgi:hypothetical protein